MVLSFFLNGLVIGLSIAAPVGPIGVLCIRRTLTEGQIVGLLSGLGAATADAIYGFIAGFGLTFISNFLIDQQIYLRLIGGGFLCFLGVRNLLSKPVEKVVADKRKGLLASYFSTFFLTLTNPVTILSFLAIFAGLGIGGVNTSWVSALALVVGVFIGSILWWIFLSVSVNIFRTKFTPQRLRWINRISGTVIIAFGLLALYSLIG